MVCGVGHCVLFSKLLGWEVLCCPCGFDEEAASCTHRYTPRQEKKKGKGKR